jgi:hypothetical protein
MDAQRVDRPLPRGRGRLQRRQHRRRAVRLGRAEDELASLVRGWYERAAFDSQGVSNPPECLSRLASSHAVTGVACDNPLGPNPPSELWYAVEATPSPPSPQKPASPQLDPCRPLRTSKGLRLRATFRRSRRVATASYGRRLRVHARLVTASGTPVVGAGFCIGVQTLGHAQVRAAGLRATDARGRFSYLLGRGGTRRVWFVHHGDGQSAAASVLVRVRAPVTLRASARSLRNRQTVVLRGRLGGRQHIRGLLVELQAWRDRRWVPFCLSRTNRAGHFRCAYRFTHSVGVHTYRMRARVAAQVGSPFETGTSRPVRVRVSG